MWWAPENQWSEIRQLIKQRCTPGTLKADNQSYSQSCRDSSESLSGQAERIGFLPPPLRVLSMDPRNSCLLSKCCTRCLADILLIPEGIRVELARLEDRGKELMYLGRDNPG